MPTLQAQIRIITMNNKFVLEFTVLLGTTFEHKTDSFKIFVLHSPTNQSKHVEMSTDHL